MRNEYTVEQMHRDFVAVISLVLMPLAATAALFWTAAPALGQAKSAVILVDGMCCQITAEPALRELSHVCGVTGVTPRYQERAIYVEFDHVTPPSSGSLWRAIERTSLRPKRIVMEDGMFNSRSVE